MKNKCIILLALISGVAIYSAHTITTPHNFTSDVGNTSFTILSCSYNNEEYAEESLKSILDQEYDNFRVRYVDDCSKDATNLIVKKVIDSHPNGHRVELIRNEPNCGAMANQYHAIHSCKPDEVVVIVDGDDYLPNKQVLQTLSEHYANPNVWLTYGNYTTIRTKKTGQWSKPLDMELVRKHGIRKHPWVTSHLRTFYAGLFQRIPLHDLTQNGEFLTATCDQATMLPMLELALDHIKYIPEVLYIHNDTNPLSNKAALEYSIARYIRKLPAYSRLKKHPKTPKSYEGETIDLLIFSEDTPSKLRTFLETIKIPSTHTNKIAVVYSASTESNQKLYKSFIYQFPKITFNRQRGDHGNKNLKEIILEIISEQASGSKYILCTMDTTNHSLPITLEAAILALKQTGAYTYYFNDPLETSSKRTNKININDHLRGWQFSATGKDFFAKNALNLSLYTKENLSSDLRRLKFHDLRSLIDSWKNSVPKRYIGIHSK